MSAPVRVAAVVGFLLLATQVVLLVLQLGVLRDSQAHIRRQDVRAARQFKTTKPALDAAKPVLADARHVLRPLGRDAGDLADATEQLPSLIPLIVNAVSRSARDVHQALLLQREALDIQRRTLDIQQRTLDLQERALAAQLEGVRIQRASLRHIESIDRKTGGELPTTQALK